MQFRLYPLRFIFVARETAGFPPRESGNIFRGAFGAALRKVASPAEYTRLFETRASKGPSGLQTPPRPFVFRTAHLDGFAFEAGMEFQCDFHLFEMRNPPLQLLENAFAGLKLPGRSELLRVTGKDAPLVLSLTPGADAVRKICVRFQTPTELKVEGGLTQRPEFETLAARIRDRISTLREHYDCGPLAIDFCAFAERAARVQMTSCDVRYVEAKRRSGRTGQTHSIGGFVGSAEYEGDLTEFLPYLSAATWTGVGRQTVWGKGVIVTERSK